MNELTYYHAGGREIEPSKKEALRYLGIVGEVSDSELERLYDECLAEYKAAAQYKCVVRSTPLCIEDSDRVKMCFCEIESEALCRNLIGCDRAFVFAATTGIGVDRLLMKYRHISPSRAMVISCIASAGIEGWCDEINRRIAEEHTVKPRFSPGYGGVSLEHQKDILAYLDAEKRIGLCLSEELMMTPVKSVTAFIGVTDKNV